MWQWNSKCSPLRKLLISHVQRCTTYNQTAVFAGHSMQNDRLHHEHEYRIPKHIIHMLGEIWPSGIAFLLWRAFRGVHETIPLTSQGVRMEKNVRAGGWWPKNQQRIGFVFVFRLSFEQSWFFIWPILMEYLLTHIHPWNTYCKIYTWLCLDSCLV